MLLAAGSIKLQWAWHVTLKGCQPLSNLLVSTAGVDVVFDTVGGTAFAESLKVVKWGAHILIIGFASGSIPKVRFKRDSGRARVIVLH